MFGVVEGFYGQPWTPAQRSQLFERMGRWRLNTFMYAPKDDIKHRALWRSLYDDQEEKVLRELISSAAARGVSFVYAIAPGLDISYSSEKDCAALKARLAQLLEFGCENFAFLFDDIDDTAELNAEDAAKFASFADAQCHVTNLAVEFVRSRSEKGSAGERDLIFLFCPTPYCGQMARPSVTECDYLKMIGEKLSQNVSVLWTGPKIISQEIPVESIQELRRVIKRKPVIWDNLHANDYDMRRVYLGPYSGRSSALREEIAGILSNPNCQYEANFVALRTLAVYATCEEEYQPDAALQVAIREWQGSFSPSRMVSQSTDTALYNYHLPPIEEIALLCDFFYLPYAHGQKAREYLRDFKWLLQHQPTAQGEWHQRLQQFKEDSNRIAQLFRHMTEIENRALLYALYGHGWGIKEEVDLLVRFLEHALEQVSKPPGQRQPFHSDFHQPHTYRGGIVADLQQLLPMNSDGSFSSRQEVERAQTYTIRPYANKDRHGVYQVCLKTGNSGKDGTHLFPDDPEALGHRYVGAYITMQKDLAIVLEDNEGVCGYALAALDSVEFYQRFRTEWLPYVRGQYPGLAQPTGDSSNWTPTQHIYNEFFEPSLYFPEWGKKYPSHLHIDLIERAQRKGLGSKMITLLLDLLREKGSLGVHLEMSAKNDGAYAFYLKLGFVELDRRDGCIFLGLALTPA